MESRFVVTGCSRSGTRYAAKLLTAAGVFCGHEDVFAPWTGALHLSDPFAMRPDLKGDSSFMAVPYLDRLRPSDHVFHQVRDPIAVIGSHVGIRFFADKFAPSEDLANSHLYYLAIVRDFLPEVFDHPSELMRATSYWIKWNEAVETESLRMGLEYVRYRIEDLDLELLRRLTDKVGVRRSKEGLQKALEEVSRTDNTRTRDESISWERLAGLPADLGDACRELAHRYGYRVPS